MVTLQDVVQHIYGIKDDHRELNSRFVRLDASPMNRDTSNSSFNNLNHSFSNNSNNRNSSNNLQFDGHDKYSNGQNDYHDRGSERYNEHSMLLHTKSYDYDENSV